MAEDLSTQFYDSALDVLTRLRGGPGQPLEQPADEAGLPNNSWRAAAAADWFRVAVEEAHGGLGLGLRELGAIFRAYGRRLFFGPASEHSAAVPMLLGGQPQWAALLESALSGTTVVSYAEPVTGVWAGDPLRLAAGRLSGAIDLVPFARFADYLIVVATAEDGPAVAIVRGDAVGIDPVASQDPCTAYGRVSFEGVHLDSGQLLCRGASAGAQLERVRAVRRLLLASEQAGVAAELTERAVAYAQTRHQFGRPIGGFQAVRHLLAEMYGRLVSLESLVDNSLATADANPDRLVELAMAAKVHSARVTRWVAAQSLQVHGAIGFTTELPLHLYLWRALSGQSQLGTADQVAAELGRKVLAG
jgi:alkylation response protein AidB-like acyl-CoA dehydrogenase